MNAKWQMLFQLGMAVFGTVISFAIGPHEGSVYIVGSIVIGVLRKPV